MSKRPKPLDPEHLTTLGLERRDSKVSADQFSTPFSPHATVADFMDSLPGILAAADLRELAGLMVEARDRTAETLVMCGGHVIKTGLAPLLIGMMQDRFVTALAVNGSVAVHDSEIALVGRTSEEVGPALDSGSFGTARETAELLNGAAAWAYREGKGLGEGIGHALSQAGAAHGGRSLLLQAHRLGVPVTVHVALGTDVVHQHPSASGEAIGASSLFDFRVLARIVSQLEDGVVLNLGSAVVLPEVFVKAVNMARNLGHPVARFTAADFDFVRQYRPATNVVRRPVGGGKGFLFTGHHELLIPLLYAAVITAARHRDDEEP
jgi:hypothetical protein